jgi:hypothetical protein
MSEPNTAVVTKWVEALESGEYKQTVGALYRTADHEGDPAGHCCLGVLCDLAVKDGVIDPPVIKFDEDRGMIATYAETSTFLPEKVMEWVGLDENNPWVDFERWGREVSDNLAILNDEEEASFEEIADILRLNFLPNAQPDAGQPA